MIAKKQAVRETGAGSISFANYPLCALDAFLSPTQNRVCNVESYGTGTVFWYSQDHINYDAMNVP